MSGHSKWAGIKHKKAIIDAKRGKQFSKLIREMCYPKIVLTLTSVAF